MYVVHINLKLFSQKKNNLSLIDSVSEKLRFCSFLQKKTKENLKCNICSRLRYPLITLS